MKHLLPSCIILLCLAPIGCEDKSSSRPEATPAASAQAAQVSDTDLAVPADYEEKANSEISADNYKKELDKIEGDLKK